MPSIITNSKQLQERNFGLENLELKSEKPLTKNPQTENPDTPLTCFSQNPDKILKKFDKIDLLPPPSSMKPKTDTSTQKIPTKDRRVVTEKLILDANDSQTDFFEELSEYDIMDFTIISLVNIFSGFDC